MVPLLSAIVALACVLASARRLAWTIAPTSLDTSLVLDALKDGKDWRRVRDAIAAQPEPTWERDLFVALTENDPRSRDALVTEQLLELDWTAQRWVRVPRVCASIATSAGFLFGCIALLQGLAIPSGEGSAGSLGVSLFSALDALTIGIAGTAFCIAVHLRTRRVVRERHQVTERLVARLLSLSNEAGT